MTTRREFLQGILTLTGLALNGAAFAKPLSIQSALSDEAGRMDFHTVVYEPGVTASAAFGAAVARHGLATHAIDGDITNLWADELADLWRQEPVAIAGMTTYPALFLLERFGWDHGLRVTFRAEHKADANGRIQHRLEGPGTLLSMFEASLLQQTQFSTCMAGLVAHCPAAPAVQSTTLLATFTFQTTSEMPALYSWIIAPRVRQNAGSASVHAFERISS